jgi:SseB protein N-terminal domain
MTGSSRYWIDRDPDGRIAHLVRIREVPYEGLWAEFFRQGRWHRNNAAVRYLMDPLLGDEVSEKEAKEATRELGYEWLGEPASPSDEEAEPPPDGLSLTEVAREVAAGRASPQELHNAFLDAQVFCEAGERPGFMAMGPAGDRVVPVFSSEEELVRARGPVPWFATTGADLFGLLPEGYDVVLDVAGEHPLRLRRAAVGFRKSE